MGTLHTTSAPQTIDRIIDACPPHSQEQVRTMLASTLQGVITQCLVPLAQGNGRVAATEILIGTDAVAALIRSNKVHQIITSMQSGKSQGMWTLNANLAFLVKKGIITRKDAEAKCTDMEELARLL
jgi:twitching motility protein PilT